MTWLSLGMMIGTVAVAATSGSGWLESDEVSPLDLADVAAYLRAFETDPNTPAVRIDRSSLLEQPGVWKGRRVEVVGRLARRFTQGAWGDLPALAEVWIVDPRQGPLCLVHPLKPPLEWPGLSAPAPQPGDWVTFRGVSIRPLRYGATADGRDRVAPLLAGPVPPVATARPADATAPIGLDLDFAAQRRIMEWGLAILLGAITLTMLLRVRLATPSTTRRSRHPAARARRSSAAVQPDPDNPFASPPPTLTDSAPLATDDPHRSPSA